MLFISAAHKVSDGVWVPFITIITECDEDNAELNEDNDAEEFADAATT